MKLFDLEATEEARLHILPVPWDATTSYRPGTSRGPQAILKASEQIDLYEPDLQDIYKQGIYWIETSEWLLESNLQCRNWVEQYLEKNSVEILERINIACASMNDWVYGQCLERIEQGKLVGLVGGDHSTPFGLMQAIGERQVEDWGILHIDAHADLRDAYQNFIYSHASIFFNVMESDFAPSRLVQVAIRDLCREEVEYQNSKDEILCFFDRDLKAGRFAGKTWQEQCQEIVSNLPQKVYISFDIDGLDPKLCPNTGTPVPGGLDFDEVLFLLKELSEQKKQILAFDLNEVSPGTDPHYEWDANVGMRLLYQLSCRMLLSNR